MGYGFGRNTWKMRCNSEDNITNNLKETEWNSIDWIHLAEDRPW
jgi:hypothetical protein